MVITKEFYFRGWLPAGLVINSRLLSSQPDDDTAVLTPIINSDPGTTWPIHQPKPVFPIAQATDVSAIILKNPFPETTLVMLPLGDWYGSGTPCILALNTWYDGVIQIISGDDVPAVRLIMTQTHLYLSMTEMDPGSLPDVCVGEMPARVIVGSRRSSALFADPSSYVSGAGVLGLSPQVTMPDGELSTCLMTWLTVKQAHTAGLAQGVPRDPGLEDQSSPDCFLRCNLVGGKVTPPVGAGKIHYYGLMPIALKSVQPMFLVGGMGNFSEVGPSLAETHSNILSSTVISDWSIAVVGVSQEEQVIHYN